MADLRWFDLSLPRDMELTSVVAVLRPLATRPRVGLTATTPLVVLEAWGTGGHVCWRLGLDGRIARSLPGQIMAHLPRLGVEPMTTPRPTVTVAADLRMYGMTRPLRTDTADAVSAGLLAALGQLGVNEAGVVQWLIGPSRQRQSPPASFDLGEALGLRQERQPDATATREWRDKTAEALFACRGRIGGSGAPARALAIVRRLADALKIANTPHTGLRLGAATKGRAAKLTAPTVPLTWSCLLNTSELAALVGWPITKAVGDELPLVGGHINPAPKSLLVAEDDAPDGERVIGESLHAGQRGQLVTMPVKTSLHHVQVVGPTGSGKSTLLASMILADIAAGRSTLVVEPRGDLINDVLARLPKDRRDRVVVIDPASSERVVGVNVLAGERTHAERRADEIVHLLSELHGGNLGPRSTDVLMHALVTAARLPDGTLCDVPVLLTSPAFRRMALAAVSDPMVLGPWWAGFEALSEPERGRYVAPLMNKLRPITGRDSLRRMLGQAAPRFDVDELFTTPGTVVLANLNRGLLGTPTANLLGALVLSQAWAAIQRRAALPPRRRQAVSIVVDEFQDFLRLPGGVDFGDALAQSRGLGVSWTLAHQHLDQLSSSQQAGVVANARSRVVFRPSPGDAKPLAAAFGGGLAGNDLLRLRAFEACVQLHLDSQPSRPFSVRTRPLPPWTGDPAALRKASVDRYGVDGTELDKAMTERWHNNQSPGRPVGVKRRATK
ncbi:type IV secretory system conjugative DNA transfer family protein [Micromonospora sp. Llam7]|uniref:type IV secretory system conjugative DNA transfer family protein n=1 Tax=Micromonospora tarapacensis TaxID=2835305 RepID=UPI001C8332FF|nr:hypothetical protein [Micromonospora tarapacensis]MBX7265552.1 type IV secretory system conjugative DNA transfer family protein [Micromonospora tarapacensis]